MSIIKTINKSLEEDLLKEQVLNEMAKISEITNYVIWVRTDDTGKFPHFHIWDKNTKGDKFHTCVRIDKPEYFHHEGKMRVFNSKEKKELIKFLKSPSRNKRYNNNWEYLLSMWNDNNSDVLVKEDQEMPDYTKL